MPVKGVPGGAILVIDISDPLLSITVSWKSHNFLINNAYITKRSLLMHLGQTNMVLLCKWHLQIHVIKKCLLIKIPWLLMQQLAKKSSLSLVITWNLNGNRLSCGPMMASTHHLNRSPMCTCISGLRKFNSMAHRRCGSNFQCNFQTPIIMKKSVGIPYIIAFKWMPQNHTNEKSTLIHVMAWCHQATSHYLSQWWPRPVSPYGITRPQWVKPHMIIPLAIGAVQWSCISLKFGQVSTVETHVFHTNSSKYNKRNLSRTLHDILYFFLAKSISLYDCGIWYRRHDDFSKAKRNQ